MNLRLLCAVAVTSFAVAAVAHADDTFHRTVTVSAQPDVYISTGTGSIRVTQGSGTQVEITGHVHAGWGAFGDVKSRVSKILANPPIQQSGNSVHVGEATDHSLFNNISIDYEIKVPVDAALNLHSGSGDIETDGVGRFLSASSGSGSVRGHQVHGPADLDSGSGDIELEDTAAGNVKAKSGSGSIRVHEFSGSLNAKTGSGDIEGEGHLQGASNLTSGSGSVRLHLTPDSRFEFEASTGSGDIKLHMPGLSETNSDSSRHHLTMAINGGGDPLEIRTGSGDIEISPR